MRDSDKNRMIARAIFRDMVTPDDDEFAASIIRVYKITREQYDEIKRRLLVALRRTIARKDWS